MTTAQKRMAKPSKKGARKPAITLVSQLNGLKDLGDPEHAHIQADELLLAYINDPNVTKAFKALEKWYS